MISLNLSLFPQVEHFTLQMIHQNISIKIGRSLIVNNTLLFAVIHFIN